MSEAYLANVKSLDQEVNPLFRFLGVQVERLEPEETVLRLPFRPEFIQGGGVVAGGVIATLADEAMAHLVLSNLRGGQKTATIEMNVRYLRPVVSGELRAVASVVHQGGSVLSVRAEVYDERERQVAQAGASFFVINPRKQEPGEPARRAGAYQEG